MKSWRKTLAALLATLLLLLLGFLFWTNINFYMQARENMQQENNHTVRAWRNSVETRLDMLYEHLYELLLTLYNNTELGAGTPMMQYATRQKCIDTMNDKLMISDDADCFFIRDEDGLQLFSASKRINGNVAYSIKSFFYAQTFSATVGLSNTDWSIEEIDGKVYFIKTIVLGKYMVGTASSLDAYDITSGFSILGGEDSCIVISRGKVYPVSGQDWTELLTFAEDGTAHIDSISVIPATTQFSLCDAQVILAAKLNLFGTARTSSVLLICVSFLCVGLFILLMVQMQRMVVHPTRVMLEANRKLGENPEYRIQERASSEEFGALFSSFNTMADNLHKMRIESYDRQLREQKDELKMLRAQLRPHFYLNAITTVSNMTYQHRDEEIRAYLAALAKYMRYMLNIQSRWVSVQDEVSHIKSYMEMQRIKFPGSVDAYVGCSEQVAETKVPHLLLFTAVENSFKHAMSLYEPLRLMVQCEGVHTDAFSGCRMVVEDNGKGFPPEVLEAFLPQTDSGVPSAKDHFGLTNIRRTLQLIYRRSDLLRLSNAPTGGAHIEIWIPEGNYEAANL